MSPMHMRWGRLYRGTPAELALEDAIAELGVPYRGQFPGFLYGVRPFPDFFLPTLGLVIEVDDPSHNRAAKKLEDEERTAGLERAWGVRVVRCTNENALEDPRGTLRAMLSSVGLWPLPNRRRPVAHCLPVSKKAPKKGKREALAVERQTRRAKSSAPPRTSRRAASRPSLPPEEERRQALDRHRAIESMLLPAPIHPVCDSSVGYCAATDPDNVCRNCTCKD